MTLGGAAQVAAALGHCPNERTLDPAVCSYNRFTYAPASRTMAFTPQCSQVMLDELEHDGSLVVLHIYEYDDAYNYVRVGKNEYKLQYRLGREDYCGRKS